MFSEDFETDFGLKQNGGGYKGLLEIVGNLLKKYWFLDSFGTDLGRGKMGRNLSKFLSSWEFHIFAKNFVNVFHIFGLIYAKNYGFAGTD